MIRIIDTYAQIGALFDNGAFNMEKWERYINTIYDNAAQIFIEDSADYVFDTDILPVLSAVYENPALKTLHASFCEVTDGLNEKIIERFGCAVDVDIVLYVGLCNGAGWVTNINGRDVILLGIEKILELDWCGVSSMYGLIYHELGHVYHKQHGVFHQESTDNRRAFIWQLFTEGAAMYFEQALVGDFNYYHQDTDGWLRWCENHCSQILADFCEDLPTMTRENQRYFGDWVNYYGHGDVGYYLGTKFLQVLCAEQDFRSVIHMTLDEIAEAFLSFAAKRFDRG